MVQIDQSNLALFALVNFEDFVCLHSVAYKKTYIFPKIYV